MTKKIHLSLALSIVSSIALAGTQDDLVHIETEIKKVVTSYQIAVVTTTVLTKKTPPELATATTTALDKLLVSQKFEKDINKLADSQCESIVNGGSYNAKDYEPKITDYSPRQYTPFVINLFNAMAKKKYRQLLWNKLVFSHVVKQKELEAEQKPLEVNA